MAEWLKAHAWKVCIRQRIGGSNPPLSAKHQTPASYAWRVFLWLQPFRLLALIL